MMRKGAIPGALLVATLLPLACVSTPVTPPPAISRVEHDPIPVAPEPAPAANGLPALPVSQMDERRDTRPRIGVLDASNEDLRTILRALADQYDLNLEIGADVQGRVTTRLKDATLAEALDAVVTRQGYQYELQDNTLRVERAGLQTELYALDFIALSRVGVGTTVIQRRLSGTGVRGTTGTGTGAVGASAGVPGGGSDVIYTVEVTDLWEDIRVSLEALIFSDVRTANEAGIPQTSSAGITGGAGGRAPQANSRASEDGRRLIVTPMAGTVLVTAPPRILEEVGAYLRTVEAAVQRQVRIEAKFVEVALDRERTYGIDWRGIQNIGDFSIRAAPSPSASGAVEFTLSHGENSITALLDALDTQGDVRVLSSPSTSTLNNQRAVFKVTTNEIFFALTQQPVIGPTGQTIGFNSQVETQQVAVGIVMDVIPQISEDNIITMNVRPLVSSLQEVVEFEQGGALARAPVTSDRELDTVVRVRNGETHVIGGLIQTRTEDVRTGIPLLMDIPLLGRLFSRTTQIERRTELVIFITPTVIAGAVPALP